MSRDRGDSDPLAATVAAGSADSEPLGATVAADSDPLGATVAADSDPLGATVAAGSADSDPLAATVAADSDPLGATVAATPASLADTAAPSTDPHGAHPIDVAPTSLKEVDFGERYHAGAELGRGGMGEVTLYRDRRIGRSVALKHMRNHAAASADAVARFLREARVQGQLQHPAIVPVYDLGMLPDGTPFFTMKRLHGATLEQVLADLAAGDADATAAFSQRKLLTTFAQVLQAVDFAHRHGVLHRDLKPSNVMLGEYGEVYVLDWGVAKIAGVADGTPDDEAVSGRPGDSGSTEHGSVMGTPGYMPPEQLRGDIEQLDARADVYALGAILFELLALEPLHARSSAGSIAQSTLGGGDARARVRCPDRDVPPELEAICVRATALDAGDRYPTVGEMAGAIERFLDGDRDLALRRELALRHAEAAHAAADRALRSGEVADRTEALREAGRALAIDPDSAPATGVMTRLLLEPPAKMPGEVEALVRERLMEASRLEARGGTWVYLGFAGFAPLFLWMGVKNWPLAIAIIGTLPLLALGARAFARARRPRPWMITTAVVIHALFFGAVSRLFGPFVLLPGLVVVSTVAFLFHEGLQRPWLTVTLGCMAIFGPAVLEWTGVLAPTMRFEHGGMLIVSQLCDMPPVATYTVLALTILVTMLAATGYIHEVRRAQVAAERQLQLQAWQLRQLVPERARPLPTTAPR